MVRTTTYRDRAMLIRVTVVMYVVGLAFSLVLDPSPVPMIISP